VDRSKPQPKWLEYVLRSRRTYIKDVELTEKYSSSLTWIYDLVRPAQSDLLGIFPIAHEDQTAFIVCKDNESAVFFDVGQAAILKSAYAALRADDPETEVFQLFLATASLKISPADHFLADKLGDSWSGPYDASVFGVRDLDAARETLGRYAAADFQPLFDLIVDGTIIAHELYHHRSRRSQIVVEMEQLIANNYDEFVKVATEDIDVFSVENTTGEQRERQGRERRLKRDYYLRERRMIVEEMACDLFAFTNVTSMILARLAPEVSRKTLEDIIALHSIAFNLHLLHLAFTERAQLFAAQGLEYELPGSMSLYNLRRLAVGVLSSECCARIMSDTAASETQSRTARANLSRHFQELQNHVYFAMAKDVVMPAIPKLKGCFELIEETFPRRLRGEPTPTANPSERLFVSSLAFHLDQSVLNRMLRSGTDSLRKQLLPFVTELFQT
jgi:hypothetical protein